MAGPPEHVRDLLRRREEARAARDYARADALRAEIAAAGFVVRDTPQGAVLEPAARYEVVAPAAIDSALASPATTEFSLHLLYEGFREDLERFLAAFAAHNDPARTEIVVVDNDSGEGDSIEEIARPYEGVRALHLDRGLGWAAARNAGLKTSTGAIVVLADLSIEADGDVLTPLAAAFADPSVGVAGPFGLTSEDMRTWNESRGPEVDAIEGYLLAMRRESLASDLICEKFKWYRNADIDLSFQVRSAGFKALVVPLPVVKHTHRAWAAVDEDERAKRSKRNHYVFFDRWKQHHDLLLSHRD